MSINKQTHIHWFNNDLRLNDQPFTEMLKDKHQHFGLYIIDPRKYAHTSFGFRKTGKKRIQFLRENLIDLQQHYRQLGSDILIIKGYPELLIPQIVKDYDASLSFQLEYATEERELQEAIVNQLNEQAIYSCHNNFLIDPTLLNLATLPNSFSGFRNKVEKLLKKTPVFGVDCPKFLPPASKEFTRINKHQNQRHEKTVFPFSGGEKAAHSRLINYLFESQHIDSYKMTRNGLLGTEYSSKFSPWLASGVLSPKMIYAEIKRYEKEKGSNDGTYWLFFELLWRDYFRHAGKIYKDKLFYASGIDGTRRKTFKNTSVFENWTTGNTTDAFINANMKELALTGFMSNRGRQNAASYLVHDLNIDWRLGAAWFEHTLLDYDAYSNQGNWMYIAGFGFNPKGAAIFDIDFQTKRYDAEGNYQEQWLNEIIS